MVMSTANLDQDSFRFREDSGTTDSSPTWLESEQVDHTATVTGNMTLRIRLQLQETAGVDEGNPTVQLQAQKNGTGGYTDVNASRTDGIRTATGTRTDASDNDQHHLDGTGTHAGGKGYDDGDGAAGGGGTSIPANGHGEYEFNIEIVNAQVSDADYFEFRASETNLATWTTTPKLTISKAAAGAPATAGGLKRRVHQGIWAR